MTEWKNKTIISAFLDTGGTVDNAALVMCRTDLKERTIYVTGAMFWKISEKDNITFGSIRNDIAGLHAIFPIDIFGVETNNYGRSEIESLEREYGIRVIHVNTVAKLTDKKKIRKGESMEKESIIKFTNSWRQNTITDPINKHKIGQIKFLKRKTPTLEKLQQELDSFVRQIPAGIGSTGKARYGAEGSHHDDGVMAMLGNFHIIKTRIFNIYSGTGANLHVPLHKLDEEQKPLMGDRALMTLKPKEISFEDEDAVPHF